MTGEAKSLPQPKIISSGTFAPNATTGTIALTFPASGTVQVAVTSDDPNAASLIATAKVTIVTPTKSLVLFPDANDV